MSKSTLLLGKQVETRKHIKLALNNVILITPTTEINIEFEYRKIYYNKDIFQRITSCTFRAPFAFAFTKASLDLDSGKEAEIYLSN